MGGLEVERERRRGGRGVCVFGLGERNVCILFFIYLFFLAAADLKCVSCVPSFRERGGVCVCERERER